MSLGINPTKWFFVSVLINQANAIGWTPSLRGYDKFNYKANTQWLSLPIMTLII